MRVLPVAQEWPKLREPTWPTWRLTRRDKDYYVGEVVQVVLHPRGKHRRVLGIAEIIKKVPKSFKLHDSEGNYINEEDAREDGFEGLAEMEAWFYRAHGMRAFREPLNKLTIRWKERFSE